MRIDTSFNKLQFYTKDTLDASNLSHKGLAILQNYFAEKDGVRNDTFIGDGGDLYKAFNLLEKANDGAEINIIYRARGTHWVPIKCQKKDGQYYIMEMDSLGTKDDFEGETRLIISEIERSHLNEKLVTVYRANNPRQSAYNNCGFFAVKDARKMQNNTHLKEDLDAHTLSVEHIDNITYKIYLTPKEHMKTIQSRRLIEEYVKSYNDLVKRNHLPPTSIEEIKEMSFDKKRSQNKSRVETGNPNRNLTILYFKDKYISHVIDEKIKKESEDYLKEIVMQYDLLSLTLDRLNLSVIEPRNLSNITPDKENIIQVLAPAELNFIPKHENEIQRSPSVTFSKSKQEKLEAPRNAQDKSKGADEIPHPKQPKFGKKQNT